ncbi:MAG TPA: translation elongation factor 4 [Bryobacteraceae bacterium]|jgi:GTP-binding protein LepA|nr:translation elongation factor 4 [Bryobacteraceae bacterium]
MDPAFIRNFSIIAHIDHGKSTLADRLLELTGALSAREMMEQVLDSMDLERERGITIKAHAVRLNYRAVDGNLYQLNLIDTPGHVDFTYEVSRSLQACEGALLVVDASQGVEAQTLANTYLALHHNLEIIPVINKIDLPSAEPDRIREQIEQVIGLPADDALLVSAKSGIGIQNVLEAIVSRVPPPKGLPDAPLRALIFDSWFDPYRGVIILARVVDGRLRLGQKIRLMSNGRTYEIEGLGYQSPKPVPLEELSAGEVGFLFANIKTITDARIGDTITDDADPASDPLPGFEQIKPMVFAGLYPVESHQHGLLRDALEKLRLNDSAFSFEPENSAALGFGFRCGFLGLLHLEIVQERLEREFQIDLITTAPGVRYRVLKTDGELVEVDNPTKWPDPSVIQQVEEPIIDATVITREEYIGEILKLLEEKRGEQKKFEYIGSGRVLLNYILPLNEIVLDFYDRLKSASRGYASLDYHLAGHRVSPMVKLDVLVAGDPIDALSIIVHKDFAYERGKALIERLRRLIPRQMFEVALQAAIGNKIIARENIPAMRKNVLAKCYGGDITRKRKLLEKQKEGKKRMKRVGRVDIPQEAFLAVLKVGGETE